MEVKKIAFLHYSYPGIGGTETVSRNLKTVFEKNGICCCFISWQRVVDNKCSDDVFYLPDTNDFNSEINNNAIFEYVRYNSIDIIINQGPFWYGYKRLNTMDCKIISVLHYAPSFRLENNRNAIKTIFGSRNLSLRNRVVATIRRCFVEYFAKRDFEKNDVPIMQRVVDNSNAFILLCNDYIDEFTELFKIKKDTNCAFHAIPNPITNQPKESANKGNNILYVGRLTKWDKRVDRLLHIWHKVQKRHSDWNLYIVGDGEEKENLIELSERLHLNNIHFEGYQSPDKYYEQSKILCLTSSSEGFGMVVLEAGVYGVVSIGYNVSKGIESIIDNNNSGFLIEPSNQDDYISKFELLMDDNNVWNKMSEAAKCQVDKFSKEKIFEKWNKLFQSL